MDCIIHVVAKSQTQLSDFHFHFQKGFPGGTSSKECACQCGRRKSLGFDHWVGKIPWSRKEQPTPVFLPGESHGQRNLEGNGPRGRKESDRTEQLLLSFKHLNRALPKAFKL